MHSFRKLSLLLLPVLLVGSVLAQQAPAILEKVVTCKLDPSESASLPAALVAADSGFAKATVKHGAPSFNLYKLSHPVTILGYTSDQVMVFPGSVTLVVPRITIAQAEKSLGLKKPDMKYFPSEKIIDDSRSILAFTFPGVDSVEGKVMVGCRYSYKDAVWGME